MKRRRVGDPYSVSPCGENKTSPRNTKSATLKFVFNRYGPRRRLALEINDCRIDKTYETEGFVTVPENAEADADSAI
jgi:hypothetical protein